DSAWHRRLVQQLSELEKKDGPRVSSVPPQSYRLAQNPYAGIGVETRRNAERSGESQHDRISVGCAPGDLLGSNRPSRSGALVNDDLLAKCLGELVGDDPCDDASATARWKGIDNRNWPDRIGLRRRDACDGRQRGSTGGQMQKISAGKFHFEPPFPSLNHLVGTAGSGLYVFAPAGRRTVNTEPLPGSLVTVTSPPIMRASLRVMAR